jgi:hypothetical protein
MIFFKKSILALAILFFISATKIACAEMLWNKELVSDVNTNSIPLASCLNKDANGIIVITRECPKGKYPVLGGDLALWEIGIDGRVTRAVPNDANGNRIWTNADYIGFGCRIASDRFGNLLTAGILNKPAEKKQKIAIISKNNKTEKTMLIRNSIENFPKIKMIPLQDNTFIIIGKRDRDGLCTRIDGQGAMKQEKLLSNDEINIFSGVDRAKSEDSSLVLAGVSFRIAANNPKGNFSKNYIFICDPNLNTIIETNFAGGVSQLLFPKVCCLNNGNIAVLYKKESADPNKTFLWACCYTKELKLIWDKEIFATDKQPFAMDITARESGGFTVGIIQNIVQKSNSLELDSFDNEGSKIDAYNIKDIIGIGGFNLMHLNKKVIAVFEESPLGEIKEYAIKAKIVAIE